jgi:hypothetical protein
MSFGKLFVTAADHKQSDAGEAANRLLFAWEADDAAPVRQLKAKRTLL